MKQKVLQLIDGLNVGGAEMLFVDLVQGLQRNNYDVVVGYSTPGPLRERLEDLGLRVVNLPRLARVDPFLLLRISWLLLRERPAIVHTHLFKSDLHGRLAAWLCRIPLIISTLHNTDAWARRFPLGRIYGWTAGLADRLIAVSEEVRLYHIQHTHVEASKVEVVANGVDLARFTAAQPDPGAIRAELGLDPQAPLIGIVGRLEPQKDHATFLQAAARVARELPAARFLVVGTGSLRDALQAQACELQLAERVIFTGIRNDIPAVLAALDLLVLSSRWEGLPVILLEALAARCPVVATEVGAIADVVRSEESALLVPAGDPAALATAALRVLRDPGLARRLTSAGFARVEAQYGMEAMIRKTLQLYQTLWNEHGAHSSS